MHENESQLKSVRHHRRGIHLSSPDAEEREDGRWKTVSPHLDLPYIYTLYIHIYYTLTQRRYNENKMKPRRRYNLGVPACSSSSSSSSSSIGVILLVVTVMVMAVMVIGSVSTVVAFRTSPWRRRPQQRHRPQLPWGCHTTIVGRYPELEWSSVVDETHSPLLSSLSLSVLDHPRSFTIVTIVVVVAAVIFHSSRCIGYNHHHHTRRQQSTASSSSPSKTQTTPS